MTRARLHKEKRLRMGGIGSASLTWASKKHYPTKRETPLAGRRAADAICGGVRVAHCTAPSPNRKHLKAH